VKAENKTFVTLEEDIKKIWKKHGWEVVKEEVGREGDLEYWKIYAKFGGEEKMKVTDKDYEKARKYFGISASYLRVHLDEYINIMEKGVASWTWFLEKVLAVMYKLKMGKKKGVKNERH
jgi:hypothetical protein